MDRTNEFSFMLKPAVHGVGVFAVHDIEQGTHLRLFGDDEKVCVRVRTEVPELFREYCIERGEKLFCPEDFGQMCVGWYLNHSFAPNAQRDDDFKWYALRDIKSGEEIVIDYNSLEEPDSAREGYYAK